MSAKVRLPERDHHLWVEGDAPISDSAQRCQESADIVDSNRRVLAVLAHLADHEG